MNYPNRHIEARAEAIRKALEVCRIYGLDKSHIIPRKEGGYYVLDETKSTTVYTIEL